MLFIKRYSSPRLFQSSDVRLTIDGPNETMCGYIELAQVGEKMMKVLHTVVTPAYRGGDIGKKLIEKATEYAKIKDAKLLSSCSYATHLLLKEKKVDCLAKADDIEYELRLNPATERATFMEKLLNIQPGGYGDGDLIIPCTIPDLRRKEQLWGPFSAPLLEDLLKSKTHDLRMLALIAMTEMYKRSKKDPDVRKELFNIYTKQIGRVNNWDLVDLSAPWILGDYSFENIEAQDKIESYIASNDLWIRRIGIVSTLGQLRRKETKTALKAVKESLDYPHHLIQKTNGWILREIGKINREILITFLRQFRDKIPSVTFSYATEHLDKETKNCFK